MLARGGSYALLALLLNAAARTGVPGMVILTGAMSAAGLYEWGRMFGLPIHHRIAIIAAGLRQSAASAARVCMPPTGWLGIGAGRRSLAGGPVRHRPGYSRSGDGGSWGCFDPRSSGSWCSPGGRARGSRRSLVPGPRDRMCFCRCRRLHRRQDLGSSGVSPPMLSPNKTREGMAGSVAGAALGLAVFAPALVGQKRVAHNTQVNPDK